MSDWLSAALAGVIATLVMDAWALVAKYVLRLPTAHWAHVGRWVGHWRRGVFCHAGIGNAAPVRGEAALGWAFHYFTGVVYGLAYLLGLHLLAAGQPGFGSALAFGLATLVAPWLIMQPALGIGVFASRAPRPWVTRGVNLSMHTVFGVGLYLGWSLLRAFP